MTNVALNRIYPIELSGNTLWQFFSVLGLGPEKFRQWAAFCGKMQNLSHLLLAESGDLWLPAKVGTVCKILSQEE